jgi:hypothetical protein
MPRTIASPSPVPGIPQSTAFEARKNRPNRPADPQPGLARGGPQPVALGFGGAQPVRLVGLPVDRLRDLAGLRCPAHGRAGRA